MTTQVIKIHSSLEELADVIRSMPPSTAVELAALLKNGSIQSPTTSMESSSEGAAASEFVALDEERSDSSEELVLTDSGRYLNSLEAAASTKVHRTSFNHRGKDWNPLTSRAGTDTLSFTVPAGYEYSHYEITPMNMSFPTELEVVSEPKKSAGGKLTIKARWKLWGLGQVNYRLSAYSHSKGTTPRVQVVIGSRGWEARAGQLITQKQPFSLILSGPEAERLWNDALKFFSGERSTEVDPVVTPAVAITIAIVTGVVALAGFATLAFVLTQAINQGCNAKANYTPGQGVAGTLSFDINGCNK